jgi:hypothetical protein
MSFFTVIAHWWNSLDVADLISACSSKGTAITIDVTTKVETGKNIYSRASLPEGFVVMVLS